MPPPAKHPDEEDRLAALRRYKILDTPDEQDFDAITRLIARLCDAPIAVINLVDRDRQWFKSEVGLGVRETPLDISLCAHAILQPELLVVPDLREDERFRDNPLVTGDLSLRFYAGALLESDDGQPLGTLCVLDDKPRPGLTDVQRAVLLVLARQVVTQMELRRMVAEQAGIIAARQRAEAEISRLYQREKRIAETFQRSLLVSPRALRFPDLLVEPKYEAAWNEANVGGDFYDAFRLPDGRIALVVGDVSGKGLAAAVRTAEVRYALRALLSSQPAASPAQTLGLLNAYLCQAHTDDDAPLVDAAGDESGDEFSPRFIVAALVLLDPATGEAVVSLAGGEPPTVLRAAIATAREEAAPVCHKVTITGLPLGVVPNAVFDEERVTLAPGDILLLVTDGLTEARSHSGEFLDDSGLLRLAAHAMKTSVSLSDMGTAILDGARAFADGALRDDACLLLARRV